MSEVVVPEGYSTDSSVECYGRLRLFPARDSQKHHAAHGVITLHDSIWWLRMFYWQHYCFPSTMY